MSAFSELFNITENSDFSNREFKAVAYLRISFKPESDENGENTIDFQEQQINRYCSNNNIILEKTFVDIAKRAANDMKNQLIFNEETGVCLCKNPSRPGLVDAIEFIKQNPDITHLICTSPCRLSRNVSTSISVIQSINSNGRTVLLTFSDLNKSFDSRNSTVEIFSNNLALSEMWLSLEKTSKLTGLKIKNGIARSKRSGNDIGKPLHGKTKVKKRSNQNGKSVWLIKHCWSRESKECYDIIKDLQNKGRCSAQIILTLNLNNNLLNNIKWNPSNYKKFLERANFKNIVSQKNNVGSKRKTRFNLSRLSSNITVDQDNNLDVHEEQIESNDEEQVEDSQNVDSIELDNSNDEDTIDMTTINIGNLNIQSNVGDASDYM